MMGVTHQQNQVLRYLRAYAAENGTAPTFDEIAAAVGLASKSGISRLLKGLERRGAIRRLPGRARAIEIINDADTLSRVSDAALLAECERRGLL